MQFDTIIQGGTVVDGTGKRPPFPADLGIVHDEISAVGELDDAQASRTIDARGKTVSPGFI
ncbi:MAG: D-aminoacylase, partial [Candidatus Poribacteria bacterium]|nr:D-aminoacylase [Candidatus Poribacteria bacterium]